MMGGRSKGQAALEYMAMISIALLIASPIIIRAQTSMQDVGEASTAARMESVLDSLEEGARLVNSQGTPARTTFAVSVPEGVRETRAEDNYILYVLEARSGNQTYIRFFDFNVSGTLPQDQGAHKVRVEAVSVEGEDDYVNITTE